ncbi:MAG: MFS transporter, partial [Candidatus Kariarchaeaceae archaeon]
QTVSNYRISEEPWYSRNVKKWVAYDLGNTIYSMVVVSVGLAPIIYIMYFEQLGDGKDAINRGNLAIGIAVFIGNIIMALVSPFLGAYSDQLKQRNGLLMKLSILCMLFMGSLIVSGFTNNVFVVLILFLFANLFYQMGLVVYDATLPFITDEDKLSKVSGYGVAVGYFGSFIGIGIGYLLIPFFGDFYADDKFEYTKTDIRPRFEMGYLPYLFPIAAVMFLLFALPMFTLKEKPRTTPPKSRETIFAEVVNQVKVTGREVYNYRNMKTFLIGWFIFVDVANTVILFMTVMIAVGLDFGEGSVVLSVQAIGIASAVLFTYPIGVYVDKNGPRKGLRLILLFYLVSMSIALLTNLSTDILSTPKWPVYLFPLIFGPGLGGTWVVQRAYVTQLSPPEKVGNYFGFANIFGRISAALGPLAWYASVKILSDFFGYSIEMSTRASIGILGILMIVGFIIINKVEDVHKYYIDGAVATGNDTWEKDGVQVYP